MRSLGRPAATASRAALGREWRPVPFGSAVRAGEAVLGRHAARMRIEPVAVPRGPQAWPPGSMEGACRRARRRNDPRIPTTIRALCPSGRRRPHRKHFDVTGNLRRARHREPASRLRRSREPQTTDPMEGGRPHRTRRGDVEVLPNGTTGMIGWPWPTCPAAGRKARRRPHAGPPPVGQIGDLLPLEPECGRPTRCLRRRGGRQPISAFIGLRWPRAAWHGRSAAAGSARFPRRSGTGACPGRAA